MLKEALEPLQNFPKEYNQTSVLALLMVGFLLLVKEDYGWVRGQNDQNLWYWLNVLSTLCAIFKVCLQIV